MEEIRTDFTKYKFRCHALGRLMTGSNSVGLTEKQEQTFEAYKARYNGEGKPLTENQQETFADLLKKKNAKPELSKTTKTYLEELHREVVFRRDKELYSKYLDKGLTVEEKAITLYSEYTGKLFIKNKERKKNKWFSGECDNAQGKIRDIKCSWDFSTFPLHATALPTSDYDWQMQGYMDLWGMEEAEVIYCLVDTPDMLIEDEKRRTSWKLGLMDLPEDLEKEIEHNLRFMDIPLELRVKVFQVERDEKKLEALKSQIELARQYLNKLSLTLADSLSEHRVSEAEKILA